ncbi:aldo/keto reductase [Paenibacillus senegalensis]|uniref:aldo/keto reductase n=1 Tax=Paenibacillus senegalensis TaxID=1465766 RepID=UPI0002894B1A|nr:aldo/keto reductase [Paenibacillus senegalensis]
MAIELPVSPLTLGTVQLGMPYGVANKSGMPDEAAAFAILNEAIDGGVTSFDTAHAYGASEKVLGRYFHNKAEPTLISKLRIEGGSQLTADEVEQQMLSQLEGSLRDLNVSRLPVLLLHNPEELIPHGRTITAVFEKLCKEGIIGYAGVSFGANTDEQFKTLWDTVCEDVYQAVQIPINVLDHRLIHNGGLDKLRQSGKTVFARSIYMQGLIFLQDDELPSHLQIAAAPLAAVREIAVKANLSVSQLATSFVRDLPGIDSLVIGVETVDQLREALNQIAGPPLEEATRQECMKRLKDVPEQVVNTLLWNTAARR